MQTPSPVAGRRVPRLRREAPARSPIKLSVVSIASEVAHRILSDGHGLLADMTSTRTQQDG